MRTLLFPLALAARAETHPSLPEPDTLEGLGVNIHFTEPQPGELKMTRAGGCRFMCSWDTQPEDVDAFAADVRSALG